MSVTAHERPGVYSSYDASSVTRRSQGSRAIGIAAKAAKGTVGEVVTVTGYESGRAVFGEDSEGGGMTGLLRLLYENGASEVKAVRVAESGTVSDYTAAFRALAESDSARIVVTDSALTEVHQALRSHVETASENRRERIAIVGGSGETVSAMLTHAAALNSERMVLVGPDALDEGGSRRSAVLGAAALAGRLAAERDPALPVNGVSLRGLGGAAVSLTESEIDSLVRGGVTPLDSLGGVLSPIRGITTRTKTGEVSDATWRELSTILIVDDVIPALRESLRSKFLRSKNTARNRGAIRSQVIVELERKVEAEIIEGYGEVAVRASGDDPTVCEVEFPFAVAHGLNQIYLTAHITV